MPKCTATKRDETPCRAWAVHNTNPPLCASHGGSPKTPGAPKGNQNARTHGAYAGQQAVQIADIDTTIADLQRRYNQLSAYIDLKMPDLDADQYVRLTALQGQLASRLGRLIRDHQQTGEDAGDLQQAIADALDQLSAEWGIEL